MDTTYLNRNFIYKYSLIFTITVTIVVYFNSPFGINYSSLSLQLISSKYGPSLKYYIKTTFIETSENIFILGASARNETIQKSWSEYVVYGQIYRHIVPSKQLSCCLRYPNGSVVNVNIIRDYKDWSGKSRLGLLHVTCPNPMGSYEVSNTLPENIALINNVSSCQR